MNILQEIAESRKQDLPQIREMIKVLEHQYSDSPEFYEQKIKDRKRLSETLIEQKEIQVISEIKPASPSRGTIRKTIITNTEQKDPNSTNNLLQPTIPDLAEIVRAMCKGGVKGVSVLTEPRRFKGSFGNLFLTHQKLSSSIALLMKDFVIDEAQIELGRLCGASNGLLIANLNHLSILMNTMQKVGMEPLIEIHDRNDLERVREFRNSDIKFVLGINNRNLKDLSIDFKASRQLIPVAREMFGSQQIIITESGIENRDHLIQMEQVGAQAALIGSSIMESPNITETIHLLRGLKAYYIKICGIKTAQILESCNNSLITSFGVIVGVPKSPRNITIDQAKSLFQSAPCHLNKVIVTKNKTVAEIINYAEILKPDFIQYHGNNLSEVITQLSSELQRKLIIPVNIDSNSVRDAYREIQTLPEQIFAVLLDSSEGQGRTIDLKAAEQIIRLCPKRKIILAGGIGIHNVSQILTDLNPFGVDVSSALERDGEKDPENIQLFCRKISQQVMKNK
jgi:indole-3-glycerol phosphate synthase/phosphoribosylanthranilate isomerase